MRRLPAFDDEEARQILERLCAERGVPASLVRDLAEMLQTHSGRGRSHGIYGEIDDILNYQLQDLEAG